MKKHRFLAWLGFVLAAANLCEPVFAGARQAPFEKPKLLLAIVVDQFRYDYLTRFNKAYTGGLARLWKEGAVFTGARYPQFPTVTAVGHSTLLTGAPPSISGIAGNDWFEREPFIEDKVSCPLSTPPVTGKAEGDRAVQSITDDSTCLVGGDPSRAGASPRRLLVSTIGDELKMAGRKSKAIGISLKDRAAILPAGRMADAAYWFNGSAFVTSTYYMPALPDWVAAFNRADVAAKFKDADWTPRDAGEGAAPFCSLGEPHGDGAQRARHCADFAATPFANEIVEEFAEKAIENEGLGAGPDTDVLTVSFSANDYVGHMFGPDSPQVRDISIRTDETIGKLLDFVDRRLGRGSTLVVFTADHGVSPSPKVNQARKMPGGWIDMADVRRAVDAALSAKFGGGEWLHERTPEGALYLREARLPPLDAAEIRKAAAEAAAKVPHIARVFTSDDLKLGYAGGDRVSSAVILGYYGGRSPDIVLVPEPYFMFGAKSLTGYQGGTTHFTPYGYDNHVPLIFMGRGIERGFYDAPVLVNDIAPTLATILDIETPSGSIGRTLGEMFGAGASP